MSHSQWQTRWTKKIFLQHGDKRHLDDRSNHDNLDCGISSTHLHNLSGCDTINLRDCRLPCCATTDMTSQEFSHDTNVEDKHDSEIVQQTIESSQLRRLSQRILAASAPSLPMFERSPAPSPPPSEERNAFLEEQRTKGGTATSQKLLANKNQLR
jgi:hypothetical protein